MGLEMEYIDDQTPLGEDEKGGLLIGTITTWSELDQFEQLNIEKAIAWSIHRSFNKSRKNKNYVFNWRNLWFHNINFSNNNCHILCN